MLAWVARALRRQKVGPMKEEQQEEHTAAALLAAITTHTACTSSAVRKRTCAHKQHRITLGPGRNTLQR